MVCLFQSSSTGLCMYLSPNTSVCNIEAYRRLITGQGGLHDVKPTSLIVSLLVFDLLLLLTPPLGLNNFLTVHSLSHSFLICPGWPPDHLTPWWQVEKKETVPQLWSAKSCHHQCVNRSLVNPSYNFYMWHLCMWYISHICKEQLQFCMWPNSSVVKLPKKKV